MSAKDGELYVVRYGINREGGGALYVASGAPPHAYVDWIPPERGTLTAVEQYSNGAGVASAVYSAPDGTPAAAGDEIVIRARARVPANRMFPVGDLAASIDVPLAVNLTWQNPSVTTFDSVRILRASGTTHPRITAEGVALVGTVLDTMTGLVPDDAGAYTDDDPALEHNVIYTYGVFARGSDGEWDLVGAFAPGIAVPVPRYAARFTAGSGYAITGSAGTTHVASDPCTVSLWFRYSDVSAATGQYGAIVYDKSSYLHFVSITKDGSIQVDRNPDGTSNVHFVAAGHLVACYGVNGNACDLGAVSANAWHHLAIVYDGANHVTYFVDGAAATSNLDMLGPDGGGHYNGELIDAGTLRFGVRVDVVFGANRWDGLLDQLAVWDGTALTTEQVAALYAAETDLVEDFAVTPTSAWDPDDFAAGAIPDSVGSFDLSASSIVLDTASIVANP